MERVYRTAVLNADRNNFKGYGPNGNPIYGFGDVNDRKVPARNGGMAIDASQ